MPDCKALNIHNWDCEPPPPGRQTQSKCSSIKMRSPSNLKQQATWQTPTSTKPPKWSDLANNENNPTVMEMNKPTSSLKLEVMPSCIAPNTRSCDRKPNPPRNGRNHNAHPSECHHPATSNRKLLRVAQRMHATYFGPTCRKWPCHHPIVHPGR